MLEIKKSVQQVWPLLKHCTTEDISGEIGLLNWLTQRDGEFLVLQKTDCKFTAAWQSIYIML